jgi:hypothetical protein
MGRNATLVRWAVLEYLLDAHYVGRKNLKTGWF